MSLPEQLRRAMLACRAPAAVGPFGADHLWESATHPLGVGSWLDSVAGAALATVGTSWTRTSEGVAQGGGTCHATTVDTAIARKFYGESWRTWVIVGTLSGSGNVFSRDTDVGGYEAQMYGGASNMGLDVSVGSGSGVWTLDGRWRGASTLKVFATAYNMQAVSGVGACRHQLASGSTWGTSDNGNIPLALPSGWTVNQARVFQPAPGTRADLGNWNGRILALATAPGIADLAAIHAWAATLGVTGL